MRNNNNFSNGLTIEAIVNKYVNAVKAQIKPSDEMFPVSGEEFASAPHQQLLAKMWFLVNGCPEEGDMLGELDHYIGFYRQKFLDEEELDFLVSNYKEAVNYIFSKRDEWLWKTGSFLELSDVNLDFMANAVEVRPGDSLYMPYWGYGDAAVLFPECKICGNVSSGDVWAFCCLRLEANGIDYDIPYPASVPSDDFLAPKASSVDFIILDVRDTLHLTLVESLRISDMYLALKSRGRMVAFVSPNILAGMGKEEIAFRNQILSDKSLKAVVKLSSGTVSKSKNPLFAMYIDKRELSAPLSRVTMIDDSFIGHENQGKSSMQSQNLKSFVVEQEESSACKHVPYEKVDTDLLFPSFYLVERPKGSMSLSKVVKQMTTIPAIATGIMPAVTIKDLSSTFEKSKVNVQELCPVCDSGKKEDFVVVNKPCVLMCSNGEKVLVGYLSDMPDTGIAVSKRISCFETVHADVATATMLLLEDYVVVQIKAMSTGKYIRTFDDNSIAKVRVYPLVYDADLDLELELEAIKDEQAMADVDIHLEDETTKKESDAEAMTDSLELEEIRKEALRQKDRMQKKLYAAIERQNQEGIDQFESYRKSVRMRKHALTQSMSAFASMFKALMYCRNRQSGFLDDADKLSEVSDLTVADAFKYLETRLESIQQKLAAIADVEEDMGKPEFIEPVEFIKSYIEANKAGWLRFKADTNWEDFLTNRAAKDIPDVDGNGYVVRKGDPLNTLYFPRKALLRIFDNIIANALAHGFTDASRNDYKVLFSWEANGIDMTLVIENNGTPIPEDVDTDNILEYGFSTALNSNGHNGIGCSEIASIMRDYDGSVKVISSPEDNYTVKYVLTFKRTSTVFAL